VEGLQGQRMQNAGGERSERGGRSGARISSGGQAPRKGWGRTGLGMGGGVR
jgi:hypothetical protein